MDSQNYPYHQTQAILYFNRDYSCLCMSISEMGRSSNKGMDVTDQCKQSLSKSFSESVLRITVNVYPRGNNWLGTNKDLVMNYPKHYILPQNGKEIYCIFYIKYR